MRAITKYLANDGTEWASAEEATRHDDIEWRCQQIATLLGPHPTKSSERVPIDRTKVFEAERQTVMLCRELWPNEPVFQHQPDEIHPMSYAARFLSEAAHGDPIWRHLWFRFACMDGTYEYEQIYWAEHTALWEREYIK